MYSARPLTRSALLRAGRPARCSAPHPIRFQSTTSSPAASTSHTSHFVAGAAGGVAGAAVLYGIYMITPAGRMHRNISKAAKQAKDKYNLAAQKLQETTPNSDQTVNYLRNFCYAYVALVPGGRQYVDAVFNEVDSIRDKHRDEADKIVKDAYNQFRDLSKSGGVNLNTMYKAYDVLADVSKKLAELSADAAGDVLDKHPQIKEKFGGSIDQLQQMGEQYGPEAKKQVDETWKQVREVVAGGLSASNLDRARKLVEDKVEQVKKLGDEAWEKGLDQAKPLLDKNPKVKELVEKNADALKQGNAKELFDKVKDAVTNGQTGDLEGYINKAVEKTKKKGSQVAGGFGLEGFLQQIPAGSEILPKLKQLKEVAEEHTDEGKQLVEETFKELKQVLDKKSDKASKIVGKANEESKK